MKITNITPYVVLPNSEFHERVQRYWTFLRIDTDEGIYGWGEATSTHGGGSQLTGHAIEHIKDLLIDEDPNNIEHIWHKIFRQYTYLGSRGLPTVVISGIDIALWDIKGKILNRPIYDLLGGKMRDSVKLYANGWFVGCKTPEAHAEAAQKTVESGHQALKLDPFRTGWGDASGQLPKPIENEGCAFVRAVRDAVGPDIDIPISPHNALGTLQIVASAHVMMTIPNFYRQEHSIIGITHYNEMLTEPLNFQGDVIHLTDRPGLGVDFDVSYLESRLHPDWR